MHPFHRNATLPGTNYKRPLGFLVRICGERTSSLPGYAAMARTLELFQYEPLADRGLTAVNRPGFAHIAFAVDDVATARETVLAAARPTGWPSRHAVRGDRCPRDILLCDRSGRQHPGAAILVRPVVITQRL